MQEISLNPICMVCGSEIEMDWHHGAVIRVRCPQCHITPVVLQNQLATNCKCCCQPLAIDLEHGYVFCSNSNCISWTIQKDEDRDDYSLFYKNENVLSYYADTHTIIMPTDTGFFVISDKNSFLIKLFYSIFKRLYGYLPCQEEKQEATKSNNSKKSSSKKKQ